MKNLMKYSVLLLASAMMLTSCNCFKKMAANADDVKVSCTPEVLALNNGKVVATIHASVPAKYWNKTASLRITPMLVNDTKVVYGETVVLQGEKVQDNGIVVTRNEALTLDREVVFNYVPELAKCELKLLVEVKCKRGKCKEFTAINANNGELLTEAQLQLIKGTDAVALGLLKECGLTIAKGVNTLQKDLGYANAMKVAANNYKNVTTTVVSADIMYKINSSKVGKKATKTAEIENLKKSVDEAQANPKASQAVYVKGYASPDGPEKFNDKLSAQRSETGLTAIQKVLAENNIKIDAASYGEDWEGFQAAVAASNIEDKAQILQVLKMYSSSSEREQEIKNLSSVYKSLKNDILPQLRRSQVINNIDVEGLSDAEMTALLKAGKGQQLTAEELLHMAEVNPEVAEVALGVCIGEYNDARAYNNLAILQAKAGKFEEAKATLDIAAKKGCDASVLNDNYALVYLAMGDTAKAAEYSKAGSADVKGLQAATEGNYAAAEASLKGADKAIALIQQGKLAEAKKALDGCTCAKCDYLRAVIANKEGNVDAAKAYLQSAIAKNPAYADKAQNDVNLQF